MGTNSRREPAVTVVVPVFNAERFLPAAIESVLRQSFSDLELILIDDGSQDSSHAIARRYAQLDDRVTLVALPRNRGVASALNIGIAHARGRWIARLDADDIALPQRLEEQVAYMARRDDLALLGSALVSMSEDATILREIWFPETHDQIGFGLLFGSNVAHPTVLIRRAALERHRLVYNPEYPFAEDYALWSAIVRLERVQNLRSPLVLYRSHHGQVSRSHSAVQLASAQRISAASLRRLGVEKMLSGIERDLLNILYWRCLELNAWLGGRMDIPFSAPEVLGTVSFSVPDAETMERLIKEQTLQTLARQYIQRHGSCDSGLRMLASLT